MKIEELVPGHTYRIDNASTVKHINERYVGEATFVRPDPEEFPIGTLEFICDDGVHGYFDISDVIEEVVKTIPFSNGLSPAEAERLAVMMEECGEVIQVIGKILRHGYDSRWDEVSNRASLEKELGHVIYAYAMLIEAEDIEPDRVADSTEDKNDSIHKWLHHQ